MIINKVNLKDFRNFGKKEFVFDDGINIIYGPNASGKTNILEAINYLATGKSFKARVEEEAINYSSDLARIKGITSIKNISGIKGEDKEIIEQNGYITKLEILLTKGEIEIAEGKMQKAPRKKLLVNGVSKRLVDFTGVLKTVVFGPWDMDLVTNSPSVRRRFLDNVLSIADREYRRSLLSYEKGIRQRNRLLFRIREEGVPRSQLLFWNTLLIKNGNYISEKRQEFINFANSTRDFPATEIIKKTYGGKKLDFDLEYDRSVISESRLEQYKDAEIDAATTLVGPHRDDFIFRVKEQESRRVEDGRDLAAYGSRGEQRMGILWIKMAELKYIEKVTDEVPVLLLDDIYSELDHEHRDIVMEFVGGKKLHSSSKMYQVIVTTADEHFLEGFGKKEIKLIKL